MGDKLLGIRPLLKYLPFNRILHEICVATYKRCIWSICYTRLHWEGGGGWEGSGGERGNQVKRRYVIKNYLSV